MDNFESILLGVVAGVITTVAIFLLKELWTKSLLPLYQKIRYQGADIADSWGNEYADKENDSNATFSLVLKQNAHKITGSMHFVRKGSNTQSNHNYELIGEYWEGYLTLNARSKDRKVFSNGTMFFKLSGNGKSLNGYFSFRNSIEDVVTSTPLLLVRN